MRLPVTAALLALAATAAPAATFKLTLLVPTDDPRLERSRLDRAALGHPTGPAADALKLALTDAKLELDAAGAALQLEVLEVADAAAAKAAAAKAEAAGAAALVTDLPAAWTLAAADAAKAPVLNIGAAGDALRATDCRRNLFHLAPSERMRADALAQWLTARKWSQVLLLTGPGAADKERAATAQAAITRYGLKLAGSKPFKLSGDPRERDLANPLLLTQGQYDVVWVVDSDGEFAQMLPFRTALPRPVVGDGGLVALAWSSRYERYGAPQVTRRLFKTHGRRMESHDWTAWIAGKALVAAAVKAQQVCAGPPQAGLTPPRGAATACGGLGAKGSGPAAAFQKALADGEVDGSKGVAMSFRPWDGQLRQPLLLTDGQGVIGTAPIDGILHPKNTLDTLGADQPEKLCKVRP